MAITSVLEGGSAFQDQLGQGHEVAGKVTTGAGANAVLTCNDRSAVLTRNATGDYTITFGEAFLVAPFCIFTPLIATFATSAAFQVQIVSVTTTVVNFNLIKLSLTGVAATILSSIDDGAAGDAVYFQIVGKRYV